MKKSKSGVEEGTGAASKIRFSATLLSPRRPTAKAVSWTFLTLPKEASSKLPSRGQTTVEGTLNGCPFRATLEPDGRRGHWLKVDRKMRQAAALDAAGRAPLGDRSAIRAAKRQPLRQGRVLQAGDVVTLEIAPVAEEPEPKVPADLRKALASAPPKGARRTKLATASRRVSPRETAHTADLSDMMLAYQLSAAASSGLGRSADATGVAI
jgi:hypothetical protein